MSEIIPRMRRRGFLASLASFGLGSASGLSRAYGQTAATNLANNPDTATFDPDGTAHITRTIPIPDTISPQGQAYLAKNIAWAASAGTEEFKQHIETALRIYPVKVMDQTIAGVPVKLVEPPIVPTSRKEKILLNFHGGGFTSDSGSMLETIPIVSLTKTRAVAVMYSLSPAVKFPVAVDQCLAVYRELLKSHRAQEIVVYGSSAGAILSGQFIMRLRAENLPIPAGLGFFSGNADQHHNGDSAAFFAVPGLRDARLPNPNSMSSYLGDHPTTDPLVSPVLGDISHFPPTLCMTGTRDLFLSATSNFSRALRRAGVPSELVVFDAMPHSHWKMIDIPESKEALEIQAAFFNRIFDAKQKA